MAPSSHTLTGVREVGQGPREPPGHLQPWAMAVETPVGVAVDTGTGGLPWAGGMLTSPIRGSRGIGGHCMPLWPADLRRLVTAVGRASRARRFGRAGLGVILGVSPGV
jgi:hypothetical protein